MPPVIVLVGPTASGKSALAVNVALALIEAGRPAEVINADSMLVYRGMNIGTAKPTLAERRGVRHHLIDILDVTDPANVSEFQRLARETICDVHARGGVPIIVGGSALYVRAIVDDFRFPGSDAKVRARLEAELDAFGSAVLHERLRGLAPESAARIEAGNGRRIVRALEVLELTGCHQSALPEEHYALGDVRQFGLDLPRDRLDARIDERVDAMWDAGLVDEVRDLLNHGLREGRTANRAIGYRQIIAMLDGECSEQEAKDEVKRVTRRFFRKQLGWYRRDPRICWLVSGDPCNVATILACLDA